MNIKKLSYDEVFGVIREWPNKCDKITPMDFNAGDKIKTNPGAALRVGYLSISLSNLRNENRGLYDLISN